MIECKNLSKNFGPVAALNDITAQIRTGHVYGLVGTNGAGKSTLLRLMAGILKPDSGEVLIDGEPVFENMAAKHKFFFITDDVYYFSNFRPLDLCNYYALYYPNFDKKRFRELLDIFGLPADRKLNTFSKGMKKQTFVISAICSGTPYIFCDETFDGLDPVMRRAVKSIFAGETAERGLTPIIASHNLRELEDICDHVGLLHKGGLLLSCDVEDMRLGVHKLQVVFGFPKDKQDLPDVDIVNLRRSGSLHHIIARGDRDELLRKMEAAGAIFAEALPLTLEEMFICETEVAGYEIQSLLQG